MTLPIVWLHFNRFRAKRNDAQTWTVRTGRRNRYARKVICHVPLTTVYRGDRAPQPRAYLRGHGIVTRRGDTIRIVGRPR